MEETGSDHGRDRDCSLQHFDAVSDQSSALLGSKLLMDGTFMYSEEESNVSLISEYSHQFTETKGFNKNSSSPADKESIFETAWDLGLLLSMKNDDVSSCSSLNTTDEQDNISISPPYIFTDDAPSPGDRNSMTMAPQQCPPTKKKTSQKIYVKGSRHILEQAVTQDKKKPKRKDKMATLAKEILIKLTKSKKKKSLKYEQTDDNASLKSFVSDVSSNSSSSRFSWRRAKRYRSSEPCKSPQSQGEDNASRGSSIIQRIRPSRRSRTSLAASSSSLLNDSKEFGQDDEGEEDTELMYDGDCSLSSLVKPAKKENTVSHTSALREPTRLPIDSSTLHNIPAVEELRDEKVKKMKKKIVAIRVGKISAFEESYSKGKGLFGKKSRKKATKVSYEEVVDDDPIKRQPIMATGETAGTGCHVSESERQGEQFDSFMPSLPKDVYGESYFSNTSIENSVDTLSVDDDKDEVTMSNDAEQIATCISTNIASKNSLLQNYNNFGERISKPDDKEVEEEEETPTELVTLTSHSSSTVDDEASIVAVQETFKIVKLNLADHESEQRMNIELPFGQIECPTQFEQIVTENSEEVKTDMDRPSVVATGGSEKCSIALPIEHIGKSEQCSLSNFKPARAELVATKSYCEYATELTFGGKSLAMCEKIEPSLETVETLPLVETEGDRLPTMTSADMVDAECDDKQKEKTFDQKIINADERKAMNSSGTMCEKDRFNKDKNKEPHQNTSVRTVVARMEKSFTSVDKGKHTRSRLVKTEGFDGNCKGSTVNEGTCGASVDESTAFDKALRSTEATTKGRSTTVDRQHDDVVHVGKDSNAHKNKDSHRRFRTVGKTDEKIKHSNSGSTITSTQRKAASVIVARKIRPREEEAKISEKFNDGNGSELIQVDTPNFRANDTNVSKNETSMTAISEKGAANPEEDKSDKKISKCYKQSGKERKPTRLSDMVLKKADVNSIEKHAGTESSISTKSKCKKEKKIPVLESLRQGNGNPLGEYSEPAKGTKLFAKKLETQQQAQSRKTDERDTKSSGDRRPGNEIINHVANEREKEIQCNDKVCEGKEQSVERLPIGPHPREIGVTASSTSCCVVADNNQTTFKDVRIKDRQEEQESPAKFRSHNIDCRIANDDHTIHPTPTSNVSAPNHCADNANIPEIENLTRVSDFIPQVKSLCSSISDTDSGSIVKTEEVNGSAYVMATKCSTANAPAITPDIIVDSSEHTCGLVKAVSLQTGKASWSPNAVPSLRLTFSTTALDARATSEDIAAQLGLGENGMKLLQSMRQKVQSYSKNTLDLDTQEESISRDTDTVPMIEVGRGFFVPNFDLFVRRKLQSLYLRIRGCC